MAARIEKHDVKLKDRPETLLGKEETGRGDDTELFHTNEGREIKKKRGYVSIHEKGEVLTDTNKIENAPRNVIRTLVPPTCPAKGMTVL